MAADKTTLSLQVGDEAKLEWLADAYAKGLLESADVPVGPICTLVPDKFHKYIPKDILKSLVCENQKKTAQIQEKIGVADIPVITKSYTNGVYQHILDNLTDLGKEAVEEIHPWIVNVLVDWANFDNVICESPIQESNPTAQSKSKDLSSKSINTETTKSPLPVEDNLQSSSNMSKVWKTLQVKTLIELRTSNETKFNKPFGKKKAIWQDIAKEINGLGNNFTAVQVEQKWKNLTKIFRDTVDHNSKSGNDHRECPFFKELEEAYGYKANVKPVFTMGSIRSDSNNNAVTSNVASDDSISSDLDEQDDNRKRRPEEGDSPVDTQPKKGKKKATQNESMMKMIENFQKESKEEQKELLSELKQQHKEKMKKEDEKIKLMEEMVKVFKK